ncbi:MAG TPA: neutral/alkaline non-lysosomal ceramidase N-terminal domain-containing protein [Acidimicrobiales bacterium]|nr:neutral/alkaline non-lysosomal ceramidase N-terminal domain-containing protein [Acidimicrobiales bacterium]
MRRLVALAAALLAACLALPPALASIAKEGSLAGSQGVAMAGVGNVDATWNVGAGQGQYADNRDVAGQAQGGAFDPNLYETKNQQSYGVQSRMSIRALVVRGGNGEAVALVKADNYLAQDLLQRRVEQLLAGGPASKLGVTRRNILWSATHDHSSPYNVTPAIGVQLFQDAFDLRMFEYEARQAAAAINEAAAHMVPVRMGATRVHHEAFKGNIVGPDLADDGTPAGYPNHFGDFDLTVMRFDDITDAAAPKPLATWVNWGQHPESLDSYNLMSADYLSALQRDVDRATGSTMVFSQGDVGSSEGPYDGTFRSADGQTHTPEQLPDGVYREWAHMGFAQMERGAYELAQDVVKGWQQIGSGDPGVVVPYTADFPVGVIENWVPGPVSHPYPSVSNCRSQTTLDGNPGAPGAPDCERGGFAQPDAPIYESMKAAGIPVPDHYAPPSFMSVEENNRIHLQAVRLGQVLLASCSCEAQVDLILNLKSRTDQMQHNEWDGYPWDTFCDQVDATTYKCENPQNHGEDPKDRSLTISKAAFDHMKAQIHNDAAGWDDPSNAVQANSEPTDPAQIKGNFTKQELQDVCALAHTTCKGFALPVGLGHTGDYNGYTVSYREYMSRDSYRKSLTTYGPHTADYMVTRLVKMAAALDGGPAITAEPLDTYAQADEQREQATAAALGRASSAAYEQWLATLPDDVGPAGAVTQPANIKRFDAATFTWVGGSNAIDNPLVTVERQQPDGSWAAFADQSGEVQTFLRFPNGVTSVADDRTGRQQWTWTANFEAFDPFPTGAARQVADGTYRFAVKGNIHQGGKVNDYQLTSQPFTVSPWDGIAVTGLRAEPGGAVSFQASAVYPRTYLSTAAPNFIHDDGRTDVCKECSFRPWASSSPIASAVVTVVRADGTRQQVDAALVDGRWVAPANLGAGDSAFVAAGAVRDQWGEINGESSSTVPL